MQEIDEEKTDKGQYGRAGTHYNWFIGRTHNMNIYAPEDIWTCS